jgi:hypothetical protein
MFYVRRAFMLLAMLSAITVSAAAASAQEIRYFVVQSSGLFEIRNVSTGGRFTIAPTNEHIHVNGRAIQVRGFTDRASRGETVVTHVRGSGVAHVAVTFHPQGGRLQTIFAQNIGLPLTVPRTVSPSTNFDNVTVAVSQHGRNTSRRLPIGSRP